MIVAVMAVTGLVGSLGVRSAAAACTVPATNYGVVTNTVSIPTDGTYRVWSRIKTPDTTNNTYMLEIDGDACYIVGGDTAIPANAWTWVDYQATTKVDAALTAGTHTYKIIGNKPDVLVDRLIFTADTSCVPVANTTGDNCASPPDTTAPSVSLVAPVGNAIISGTVNVSATASDDTGGSGIAKVDFYVDGLLNGTDTTGPSPYTYSLDATTLTNGSHTLAVKAYDNANNASAMSSPLTVNVANSDTESPTTPTNVTTTAVSSTQVVVRWTASTDNVGVTAYCITRDGVSLGCPSAGVTSYTDSNVLAGNSYAYTVTAMDSAGNYSAASSAATIIMPTPVVADTTAPTAPANFTATAVSASQINLGWSVSTDNIGVTGYDVYRNGAKVASVAGGSFGDAGLAANTQYSYYVVAKDAAGNVSAHSVSVSATTQSAPVSAGNISGTVSDYRGHAVYGATVAITFGGANHLYSTNSSGVYAITNVPAGSYKVTFSANKYPSQTATISVTNGATTTKNVTLAKR
jgi:chitodextrinase